MGATADEINREISATRDEVDRNLTILQRRAASSARRYGSMAAAGLAAGLLVAGVAYVMYRQMRKPSMSERIRGIMPDALGELPDSVRQRLKRRPVRVVISTSEDREQMWQSVARKVAPGIATTVVSAAVARFIKPERTTDKDSAD